MYKYKFWDCLSTKSFLKYSDEYKIAQYEDDQYSEIKEILKNDQTGNSYVFINLDVIAEKIRHWFNYLPHVQPHYAVKCLPDIGVLKYMRDTGVMCYDCASYGEINAVMALEKDPARIIYAHPIKSDDVLKYTKDIGLYFMTVDNLEELHKIADKYNEKKAKVLVRLVVADGHSVVALGPKFGATVEQAKQIILESKGLSIDIVGVSFHVGTGCTDPTAYLSALKDSNEIFTFAGEHGIAMKYLDVGGGFPGNEYIVSLKQIADIMIPYFNEHFMDTNFISEPGRYFSEECIDICVRITHARRVEEKGQTRYIYRINEGTDGLFKDTTLVSLKLTPEVILKSDEDNENNNTYSSTIKDNDNHIIVADTCLPALKTNDWLIIKGFGAYSRSLKAEYCIQNYYYLIKK